MFTVKEAECVGFDSNWKVKKVSLSNSISQTEEILKKDSGTSSLEKKSIETQTDPPRENYNVNYDSSRLESFLKKIYPKVAAELDDYSSTQIFKNYSPFDEPVFGKAKILQTLKMKNVQEEENNVPRVSSLSWNCTGNTLAVGIDFLHQNWCHHNGNVFLYTLDRYDIFPEIPNKKLKTSACVTAVSFHPSLRFMICAGSHTGGIYLWNIQRDETDVLADKILGHDNTITDMQWIKGSDKIPEYFLVTSSIDSFINVWKLNENSERLVIKTKYKIKPPLFNKIPLNSSQIDLPKTVSPGILSFQFSFHNPEIFVVAAEGGIVVQCSTLGAQTIAESANELAVLNPCVIYHEPHNDQITNIKFSPNHKEQFMTNGLDGEIRIYLLNQEDPVRIVYVERALNATTWIPYYDKLISGCGKFGFEVFNVLSGEKMENICDDEVEDLIQIATNTKRPSTVITGSSDGKVQLWSIPWGSLTNLEK